MFFFGARLLVVPESTEVERHEHLLARGSATTSNASGSDDLRGHGILRLNEHEVSRSGSCSGSSTLREVRRQRHGPSTAPPDKATV